MTTPEKYYRFRALNEGPGFRRTRKATAYKKGSERLIGRGLCAAMTMRWLEDGTVPTAFEEFATLQDFYSRTLDEMDNENYATTALAKKCHLTVTGVWPEIKGAKSDNDYLSKCIAYWQDSHFQTAISQYVAGELTTGQTLPCQVGFYVNTKVKVSWQDGRPGRHRRVRKRAVRGARRRAESGGRRRLPFLRSQRRGIPN